MHWWGSHGSLCKACEAFQAGWKAEGEGWAPMAGHLERWAEASKAKVRRLDFLLLVQGRVQRVLIRGGLLEGAERGLLRSPLAAIRKGQWGLRSFFRSARFRRVADTLLHFIFYFFHIHFIFKKYLSGCVRSAMAHGSSLHRLPWHVGSSFPDQGSHPCPLHCLADS